MSFFGEGMTVKRFDFQKLISACVTSKVHLSPPNSYFSATMMSWVNVKYFSKNLRTCPTQCK